MSSRCEAMAVLAALSLLAGCGSEPPGGSGAPPRTALTVCADPNNLPFSNRSGEGFELQIAAMLADDLGLPLRHVWWPQRRGFARNTLNAGTCDLIAGVPAAYGMAATTRPYYTSSYVFVTRAGDGPQISSFDDPRLRTLRIGLHAVGDDYGSVPPALALATRGIVGNLHGYRIQGDYGQADPPARLIEAVAKGEIDVAIAWGPLAGFFAQRAPVALRVTPVVTQQADSQVPMQFPIAMAVRRDDIELRERIDALLVQRAAQIRGILRAHGVPLVPQSGDLHAELRP